jgi:CubicO group peptidase (beta-lactamase class C family)
VLVVTLATPLAGQAPPVVPATTPPALLTATASASTLPRLRSLLVSRRGELVLERYYHGMRASTPANIKSASKSVMSALVGAALSSGHLTNVNDPVAPYLAADLGPSVDPRKRAITIEHLLTMRSGLESTSGRNYGAWVTSANWVRYALGQPLIADPGTAMEYSTGNSHLLSAVLTKATRRSTWQFAQEALAQPLGFRLARWPQDPQGVYFGGNDMLMTPRQMVRFGELYLNDGRVGERRILPEGWVARSFVPRGRSRWGNDREYGYGWWIRTLGATTAYYAWGYGGQFIFVVPDSQLVIVTTSDPNVTRERREHLDGIYTLAEAIVGAWDRTLEP